MNRRFISSLMFAALLGAGMITVSSCADYDEDLKTLGQQVSDNTTVTNTLQTQLTGMQTQIAKLEEALKAMKSCQCGDVDAKIADAISKALSGLNYATPADVAKAVNDALASLKTGLTAEEVQALIETYHNAHPGCNCGDIEALIKQYLAENPGLTTADIEAIVKAYHDAHPGSTLTETDVKSIVETYINQLQHFTKEQIEAMINTAITQALANYVSCTCDTYTKSQIEALITAAIEAYAATDGHGLTEAQVNALINAAITEALKGITHPESGISEDKANELIAAAIQKALESVDAKVAAATEGLASKTYVQQLIEEAKCNCPALTTEDVTSIASSVIEQYMKDHPYTLDTEAVKSICNTTIANSEVINNIQSSITTLQQTVETLKAELDNLKQNVYTKDQLYTKTEVESLINSLIAAAISNYAQAHPDCSCDNTVLSAEQQAIVDQLIAAAIDAYAQAHPEVQPEPGCNCQYDAAAFQAIADQVAANAAAIAAINVPDVSNFVTNEALQQAIAGVVALIPGAPDLSEYVTISTLNSMITTVNESIASAQSTALQALQKANEVASAINGLQGSIDGINGTLGNIQGSIDGINGSIDGINGSIDGINGSIDGINGSIDDINGTIGGIQGSIDGINGSIDGINGTLGGIQGSIDGINGTLGDLQNSINGINGNIGSLQTTLTNLQSTVTELGGLYVSLNEKLDNTLHKAEVALNRALSNYFEIESLKGLYSELDSKLQNLENYDDSELRGRIEELESKLNDLQNVVTTEDLVTSISEALTTAQNTAQQLANQAAATALTEAKEYADGKLTEAKDYTDLKIGDLKSEIAANYATKTELQTEVNTINGKIDEVNSKLTTIESDIKDIKKVTEFVTKLITGIELQGTVNPAFGYYSLPVGITSNVLLAYFGENEHDTYFPTFDDYDLVYGDKKNWITEEDYARIGFDRNYDPDWTGGSTFVNREGNAGKLYLTVNPSSVNFQGTKFKLVNSLGEESVVKLGDLKPSHDKLTFGQSRANTNSANGFYETTATVSRQDVKSMQYPISSETTAALEDIVKNKTNANISGLSQAIYKQFNGVLDAYAVQASWSDELGEHTVTSKYGIAATAIKPLSYKALHNLSFKLPTITPLSERGIDLKNYIKLPEFDFNFDGIDAEKFKDNFKVEVHFSDIWVEDDGSIWTNVHMTSYIKNGSDVTVSPDKMIEEPFCLVSADGTFNGPIYDYEGGINPGLSLTEAQRKAINAMVALIVEDRAQVWSAQLQDGFNGQLTEKITDLVGDVNGVITKVSDSLKGTLGDKLNEMIDKANNKLNSALKTADKFIDQLNKVIDAFNSKVLGDGNPNLRLQSQLFYEGNDGNLHAMSNAKAMPTIVEGNGKGLELSISSYTGEILAPAYKKFVAVTNVYRGSKDADSDPELMKALKTANSVDNFCKVISGDHYAVVLNPTVKGATYEVVYSALDFHGQISQRKYYVYVK